MSDGYKVIKLFSGYAIVHGHSLIDITSDKRGGLYVSEDEARIALRAHLARAVSNFFIEEGESVGKKVFVPRTVDVCRKGRR